MNKIDSIPSNTYIVGDFHINLSLNDLYFLKKNMSSNKSVPSQVTSKIPLNFVLFYFASINKGSNTYNM